MLAYVEKTCSFNGCILKKIGFVMEMLCICVLGASVATHKTVI